MAANVRIQPRTHRQLQAMAESAGRTMPDVLAEAIDKQYRSWLLAGLAEDYARLRADKKAWAEECKERELWDKALGDGLKEL
jgi:hypothetical protein